MIVGSHRPKTKRSPMIVYFRNPDADKVRRSAFAAVLTTYLGFEGDVGYENYVSRLHQTTIEVLGMEVSLPEVEKPTPMRTIETYAKVLRQRD